MALYMYTYTHESILQVTTERESRWPRFTARLGCHAGVATARERQWLSVAFIFASNYTSSQLRKTTRR